MTKNSQSKITHLIVGLTTFAVISIGQITNVYAANNGNGNGNSGKKTTTTPTPAPTPTPTPTPTPIQNSLLPLIDFSFADVGKTFQFNFDGNVATQNVPGISSIAWFTLTSFNGTIATFDVQLDNTSSNNITSRTSALGFNVYSGLGATNKLDFDASVASGGLFSKAIEGGSFPNQFGSIDVCFTTGNTCQGGQSGGINTDAGMGNFSFTLDFNQTVEKFALGNLGVRYQSINGNGFDGDSGTGRGTYYQPPKPQEPPKKVPEPSANVALGLLAASSLGLLKKNKKNLSLS